jgi:hypothetical protein
MNFIRQSKWDDAEKLVSAALETIRKDSLSPSLLNFGGALKADEAMPHQVGSKMDRRWLTSND